MGRVVTAPLVIVRTKEQGLIHLYVGQPVPGNADPEDVKRLAEEGFLGDDSQETNTTKAAPAEQSDEPARPAGNATKEEWATYAVDSGKATPDEVKGLTRDELRGLYS